MKNMGHFEHTHIKYSFLSIYILLNTIYSSYYCRSYLCTGLSSIFRDYYEIIFSEFFSYLATLYDYGVKYTRDCK